MSQVKRCSPECKFFRCGRKSLTFRGEVAWCKWTNEECDPANCNYAMCSRRRLLPGGICGETVKRRTVEKEPEEFAIKVRVPGKVLRKLGEEELF